MMMMVLFVLLTVCLAARSIDAFSTSPLVANTRFTIPSQAFHPPRKEISNHRLFLHTTSDSEATRLQRKDRQRDDNNNNMDDDDYDNDNDVTAALLLEPVASSSSAAGAIPWLDRWKDSLFLGITPTPEIVAILIIYFVEGALGLAQLAQTFLFKDELHLGPAEASAFSGLFFLPWTIKPLYGFLSDGFPLLGSKRRSYLILCGLVGCLADVLLGNNFFHLLDQDSTWILPTTVGALLMSSACIAFSDVVADGIVVQQTRDSDDPALAGGLQSLCWGSSALGGLLSAYFSGSLLEIMSPRDVFTVCAALPFFVTLIAFWINEPTPITTTAVNDSNDNDAVVVVDDQNAIVQQAEALWSALQEPNIWKPAVFMFLWQSTPSSSSAFLYFLTNDLGFGPEFLGRARLVTNLASLAGVWLYQKYLRTVRTKKRGVH